MSDRRHRTAGLLGAAALAGLLLAPGCGEEPPPPIDAPVEITPGMEKMKAEMIKNFKGKVQLPAKTQ